jgi:aminoglycoside N3'-acetyltransferase
LSQQSYPCICVHLRLISPEFIDSRMAQASTHVKPIAPTRVAEQLRELGVREGGVLVAHISYRAVRPVEGGPAGLIEGLSLAVGHTGTLVMPSWGEDDDSPFDPARTPAAKDLGVTADLFWRRPGVRRSEHPFAFAALGPQAAAITADPLPLPPHRLESPIGRVYEAGGQVLLLGVGHDANTTIHLAEVLANVPYGIPKHCRVLCEGRPVRVDYVENDCCCACFILADAWLRERRLQREAIVGNAKARLVSSRDVVAVVKEQLARDPLIFLHAESSGCEECEEARRSVGTAEQTHRN